MTKEQKILFYIYKINKIKIERLFILLSIPLQIIQVAKANNDLKLLSLLFTIVLYEGIALAIYTTRQKNLKDIKSGSYEGIFSPEEIVELIEPIEILLEKMKKLFRHKKRRNFKSLFSINHNRKINLFLKNLQVKYIKEN